MAHRTQGASGSGNLTSALDQALGDGDDFLSGEVTIDQIHKLSSELGAWHRPSSLMRWPVP